MIRLAIFASGGGSNAEAIINHFKSHSEVEIALILSNRKKAGVLKRAENHNLESETVNKEQFQNEKYMNQLMESHAIDYIILAGFLLLIPEFLIKKFPNKIINIHPSLLPKFGGKGMYGHHVHQAVFDHNESVSGMTIHLVNEKFDDGKILFQEAVDLAPDDTPDVIATKVLKLEHMHYPRVIEKWVTGEYD